MGMRPFFGTQTITGSVQPCFGTSLTAAITPPPDPFAGSLQPGTNETQCILTVTSTKGFLPGDRAAVGPTASFGLKPTTIPDQGTIKTITDATHLVVQGLKNAHAATGEWVVLNEDAGNVHGMAVVTAAPVYIGAASSVSSSDPSLLDILPIVASAGANPLHVFDAESIGMSQPFQTAYFWMIGTANDTVLFRFSQV